LTSYSAGFKPGRQFGPMSNDEHPSYPSKQEGSQPAQPIGEPPKAPTAFADVPICVSSDLSYALPILPDEIQMVTHMLGDSLEEYFSTLSDI
jgi:hypothetical protein